MPPIDRILLEKYISGECSKEEEAQVHRWLDANDVNDYPNVYSESKQAREAEAGWQRMTDQFDDIRAGSKERRSFFKSHFRAVASVIVILAGLSVYMYRHSVPKFQYGSEYRTTYGEIKRFNLPDGTTVTLNACSVLEVAKDYNRKNRDVYIKGEAYFEVKQQAGVPFTVNAKEILVTALGTSFDVSAFHDDPAITVSLNDGKARVKPMTIKSAKDMTLAPGEEVVYKKDEGGMVKERFNPRVRLAWQKQIIFFEDADMQEVVRKLERAYGVTINTQNLKPRHWRLTGDFKNQTLNDVLESLSFNYSLKYKIHDNVVILYDP